MRVLIGVADTTAVQDERTVKQVAVAIGHRLQLVQEVSCQADVILVDFSALFVLDRAVLVVRHRVVGGVDTELWIRAAGLFLA